MKSYTLEYHTRVYDDDHGVYIAVGHDGDGLDCVEIKTDGDSAEYFGKMRVTLQPEHAIVLAEALVKVANNILEQKK